MNVRARHQWIDFNAYLHRTDEEAMYKHTALHMSMIKTGMRLIISTLSCFSTITPNEQESLFV